MGWKIKIISIGKGMGAVIMAALTIVAIETVGLAQMIVSALTVPTEEAEIMLSSATGVVVAILTTIELRKMRWIW